MIGNFLKIKGFKIDPVLFQKGYCEGRGPWRCTAQCCAGGVYLSQQELRAILCHLDRIREEFDETQTRDVRQWFEPARADEDFPGGVCVGIRVYNGKCVFLEEQKLCVLQKVKPKGCDQQWGLKPFYCRIYPLSVDQSTITFDRTMMKKAVCCSISSRYAVPVAEACREELTQILGRDGYRTILKHFWRRRHQARPRKRRGTSAESAGQSRCR